VQERHWITARRSELDSLAEQLTKRWPGGRCCSSRTAADAADESALPGDYRKILAIVRDGDRPVQVRAVGERLGLDASVYVTTSVDGHTTLVLRGSQDTAAPLPHAGELAEGISGAKLVTVGTGHLAVEEPQAVGAALLAHLRMAGGAEDADRRS